MAEPIYAAITMGTPATGVNQHKSLYPQLVFTLEASGSPHQTGWKFQTGASRGVAVELSKKRVLLSK